MFRLAHLSDPHLGPLPAPELLQLLSKRILGYVNWRRNRKKAMGGDYLAGLVDDMLAGAPDHIALTGDLVNIALPLEIEAAKVWLDAVAPPELMSLVPGNHDAYVPGALKSAFKAWRPYMTGDRPAAPDDSSSIKAHFPICAAAGNWPSLECQPHAPALPASQPAASACHSHAVFRTCWRKRARKASSGW